MKVFTILLVNFLVVNISGRLISTDEAESLFIKLVSQNITEEEQKRLQDIFEIGYFSNHIRTAESLKYQSSTKMEESRRMQVFDAARFRDSSNNMSPAKKKILCFLCRRGFAALFYAVKAKLTDDQISSFLSVLCYGLGIENKEVCQGAVFLNLPVISYIIQRSPAATPHTFCSFILQSETDPNSCPTNDDRYEWKVELPPKPYVMLKIPLKYTKPIKIAVITDAHIDPQYEPFGVANCDEPTCCRKDRKPAKSHENNPAVSTLIEKSVITQNGNVYFDNNLVPKIKDLRNSFGKNTVKSQNDPPAGFWGDYRYCDTPLWAFDDAIDSIIENHKDVDVVYYLGDTIGHSVWETTYVSNNIVNTYIIEKLRQAFGDNVSIVPVIGNHESQPINLFAPSYVIGEKFNTTWLYNSLATKWGFYLSEQAKHSLRERGSFSMLIKPGLRVISLNNNIAYRLNWWLIFDPKASKRQLEWLVEELYKAEILGEQVHILSHIAPGYYDLQYTWTREYNRVVNRFSSIIKAAFTGHSHEDEFKVFYSPENKPINVVWGAGGLTTYDNYNVNYKIVTVNPVTLEPIDIFNYIYNLTEANLTPNRRPRWFKLYDFRKTFGLADLSPATMNNLLYSMASDKNNLLDLYAAFSSKISDTRWPNCDNNCKIDILCRTVITVLWNNEKCEELRILFFS